MAMPITIDKVVPDFTLPATNDQDIRLHDLRGKNVVLYFYPKDSTPGCTLESQDFRDHAAAFKKLNTVILGVSRDSIKSHHKFRDTQCLPFDLLSDSDEILCKTYDVIKMKNMYGKQVRGIERSTFLIDTKGVLRQVWRKVKVDGHVAEVLAAVKGLE